MSAVLSHFRSSAVLSHVRSGHHCIAQRGRVLAGGGGGAADIIELDARLLVDPAGQRPNMPSVGPLRRRPANMEAAFRARAVCLEPAADACFMEEMLARQPDQ
jgi:hypothetical protein